jgi:hypothetical protein
MTRNVDAYPHGTRARYVWGCRCGACREANRVAGLRYRHTGTTLEPKKRSDAPTQPRP